VEGGDVVKIQNPDVSQAFYGNLEGQPNNFKISLQEKQEIYLNILVPDISNIQKNILVEVTSDTDKYYYYFLDGSLYNWEHYYEEFAGDSYYKGPEARLILDKGEYNIKVFNSNDKGKYVLVVGDKEEFPLKEVFNTLLTLPQLKMEFFGKSVFTIFLNKIGLYFFLPIVVALALILVLIILIIIYYKRKKAKVPWILK
jgi:hypothetical protein